LFLLNETEPPDPFLEKPPRDIALPELHQSAYLSAAYNGVTPRTFVRELTRLADLGFIKLTKVGSSPRDSIVELDFGAIAKYQVF